MSIQITITDAGRAEIINAANTGTAPVTITQVGLGSGQYTPTAGQTALQTEIKRLSTIAGEIVADDTIHVTIKDESNDAYNVSEFGLFTDSGTLFAVYSQSSGPFMQKAAASTLLLAVDVILGTLDATNITFGDTSFANPPASETVAGVVELATAAEAIAGTDNGRAVHPAGLAAAIAAFQSNYTTPPQFDNDTSLATTAFVQRALGNMAGSAVFAASTVLNASHCGKWIAPSASGVTFTLPEAGSVPNGSRIAFFGNSQTGCVITRSGTDIIVLGQGVNTSVNLLEYDSVEFISVGAGWYAISGEAKMKQTSSFASSLAASGYQKLPSGLIIQWGQLAPSSLAAGAAATITFPIAFTSATYSILTTNASSVGGGGVSPASSYGAASISVSQFSLQNQTTASKSEYVWWFAIGK